MRMYCIVAKDSLKKMNGNRGKLAAQAGHAYLHAWWDAMKPRIPYVKGKDNIVARSLPYMDGGNAKKVCLAVDTVADLLPLYDAYKNKTGVSLVRDAGLTCFDEPTVTCLGIGPLHDEDIGEDLKLLKVLI